MLTKNELELIASQVRKLDCGVHYCRYCSACSPEWQHSDNCPYAQSLQDVERVHIIIKRELEKE